MYETITLHFSPGHAQKILKGGACQLDVAHLMGQQGYPLELQVHKTVGNRLRRAVKRGKSVRVYAHEVDGGGKFLDWFKNLGSKIKSGYEKIKPYVAPLVKEAATKLADVGTAAVAPYLPSSVNQLITENKGKAVDALGNVTGAYGMCGNCGGCGMTLPTFGGGMPLPTFGGAMVVPAYRGMAVRRPQPFSNWSTQAMPLGPAMTSKVAYPGWGLSANFDDLGANLTGEGFRVI